MQQTSHSDFNNCTHLDVISMRNVNILDSADRTRIDEIVNFSQYNSDGKIQNNAVGNSIMSDVLKSVITNGRNLDQVTNQTPPIVTDKHGGNDENDKDQKGFEFLNIKGNEAEYLFQVMNACIVCSKDKVWMDQSYIAHFMSADCVFNSNTSK